MKIPAINWSKILLLVLAGIIVAFLGFQIVLFGVRVRAAWTELEFAFTKPNVVRVVRESYQEKQIALEKSFLQKQKTAEEKLLEAVADEINSAKSK